MRLSRLTIRKASKYRVSDIIAGWARKGRRTNTNGQTKRTTRAQDNFDNMSKHTHTMSGGREGKGRGRKKRGAEAANFIT